MRALAFVIAALFTAPAFAQIYYLPVQYQYHYQYQYSAGSETFYYGGTNPNLYRFAVREAVIETIKSNHADFNQRFCKHTPVYSDVWPYQDLRPYGFTAAAAANEANWNAPRYFRKADLLRAAIPQYDGSWVLPADAQPVVIPRPVMDIRSTTRSVPATRKGEIIIIPKNLLDRKLKDFTPRAKQVASAT
jgi:hypothetical protein